MFDSIENYKEWNIDHIIPKNAGGNDNYENLAFSCRTSNVSLKSRTNLFGDDVEINREQKVLIVKKYISNKRADFENEINNFKLIVSLLEKNK